MLQKRLEELIQERFSNRKEFAKEFGVPYTTLNNWLNGVHPTEPDFATLGKIADFFDVSVDYLLGRTENVFLKSSNTELNVSKRVFELAVLAESLRNSEFKCLKSYADFLKQKNKKPAE